MKDGWHKIAGYDVYVESNCVRYGICKWKGVTTYPYRKSRYGGWDNCSGISIEAFRAGVRRETMMMN
jgi:hypothetical protein